MLFLFVVEHGQGGNAFLLRQGGELQPEGSLERRKEEE